MKHKNFAAFIMTYERPKILLRSVEILRTQTHAPEFILVIDNSSTFETSKAIKKCFGDSKEIGYFRVGYNSGPAGASKIGLEKLANLGYKWIYWGDDDNPPRDAQVFEEIFKRIKILEIKSVNLGIIGGKGARLNKLSGKLTALTNADLKNKEVAEVDYVPGGQTMIVNSSVVKLGLLPENKLFFSFEDLEFCLKVKNKGFKIFVDAKTWYMVRKSYDDNYDNYRYRGSSFGNKNKIVRSYYSTRSFLYILFTNSLYIAFLLHLFKSVMKMLIGFKFGMEYGKRNFKFQTLAILHFFQNNYEFKQAP